MENGSAEPKRLEGKVALITGGASGIGEYTAKSFVKHGAKVMIADIQDELGQNVCNNIGQQSASYIHCDVTIESHLQNAVDSTLSIYGKLDIMINNAGFGGLQYPNILDNTQFEFEKVMKVNLVGPFLGTKHAARVMMPAQRGSIINMGSISCSIAGAASHAYVSSKHGVLGLTKNSAVELGKYGIRVNCLSSHVISTPMTRDFFKLDDEGFCKVYSNIKGAMCTLEDVAQAALYLASDDSKFVSGHNLVVDGGFSVLNRGFCMF
ncbi:borneol dehydrogenase, mitochondrial-like [Amaranthus tricolor]|uniref:borneol dehydrogenase, mitochondrial-like n=1 Tax=Amaranthus tricolor TaxID=29722 RepID=UPI00258AB883|nr:borneol dehydrogenase, mitochondrial-like [Amaranthus tricolor]